MISISDFKPNSNTSIVAIGVLLAAVIFATVPLEVPELTLSLVGAIVYSALQAGGSRKKKGSKMTKKVTSSDVPTRHASRPGAGADRLGDPLKGQPGVHQDRHTARTFQSRGLRDGPRPDPTPKKDYRQPSAAPISAPSFSSVGWEAEVRELLQQSAATPETGVVVQKLLEFVRSCIQPMLPEAEVTGFATGNLKRGKAFGVAVPDLDIVVSVTPAALVRRLQQHLRSIHVNKLDARKLQKSAIRACTDQLVSVGHFKFRRSAFKGQEPKVTLLAPSSLGLSDDAIPVDLSVNTATPLHNAALMTECGQLEPRAKDLILLVQRWARDRGISHAAKGHLPLYAWSLLTIYFLQVGADTEEPFLPSLDKFTRASVLLGQAAGPSVSKWAASSSSKGVGSLFKEFVHFYETQFEWRSEAVSVRLGSRAPPGLSLPIHVALCEDGTTTVAPSIEDPFEVSKNVGTFLTGEGVLRLREELARALEHFARDASLSELLEPWAPPEWVVGATENDGCSNAALKADT